jgi:hypothetical protein
MRMDLAPFLSSWAVALWLAGVGPAAAESYPRIFRGGETWVHAPSGMTFPAAVGSFRQTDRMEYDDTGLDVSSGYALEAPGLSIVATVYVYPAPAGTDAGSACREEFERRKSEVLDFNLTARLLSEEPSAPPPGGAGAPGTKATFEAEIGDRGTQRAVRTELYVFCPGGGRWDLEYRITRLREAGPAAAAEAISTFMRTLRWTLNAGSTP